jgi:LPS-assembly protein
MSLAIVREGRRMVLRLTCLASTMLALTSGAVAYAQAPATPSPTPQTATAPQPQQAEQAKEDVLLRAKILTEDTKNNILIAEGDVEVRVGQRALRADRLVYDRDKQTMRAQGKVQIVAENGSVQFADEFEVDEDFRNGFATRFSARLGGNAVATASSAIRSEGTINSLEQVVGCPICEGKEGTPTWELRARRAVQNQDTQMISYQDAVLVIKGVPILYIPYFAHPDPTSKRRSGLLVPDAGGSSRLGTFYEQPYYVALSPSQDLMVSPLFSTNVNPLIKLNYRKRFFSGYVEADGSFTYEQDFDSKGNKFGDKTWRSHLYALGQFAINDDWKWGFGVETQTDDLYDQRYDIDGEDDRRGLFASQPRQLLTQLYATGQDEDFYVETALLSFQGLRSSDIDTEFPKVAPSIFAEKVYDFGANGALAADFSAVGLFRDTVETLPNGSFALDTARATGSLDWNAQYITGPGVVVAPFALGRGDFYRINDGQGAGPENISRVLGVAGTQVSMPFVRRGKNLNMVVEPVAMVAYGSEGANDPRIPDEDSLLFESDDTNLFKPNSVTNYDLWEGGLRTAVGLNTRAEFNNGMSLSGLIGRRWRAEADPAFSQLSNLAGKKSDYIASVKVDLGKNFRTGARARFNDNLDINRLDVEASGSVWRVSGGARYFKIADNTVGATDEGVLIDGSLKFTDHLSGILQQQRNITDARDIRLSIGLAYRDECSFFAISYERSGAIDRTLGPSDSIKFQFVLTGLGGR